MLQKVVEIDRTKFFVKFIEKHWIEFLFYFRRKTKSSTDWAILFRVSSEPLSSFLLFWKFFAYTVHACIESRIIYRNGNPIRCLFLLFYTWNLKKTQGMEGKVWLGWQWRGRYIDISFQKYIQISAWFKWTRFNWRWNHNNATPMYAFHMLFNGLVL